MDVFHSQPGPFEPIGFDDTAIPNTNPHQSLSQAQIFNACYNNCHDIKTKTNNNLYYLDQYDRIDFRNPRMCQTKADFLEHFADPDDLAGSSSNMSPPPNPDIPPKDGDTIVVTVQPSQPSKSALTVINSPSKNDETNEPKKTDKTGKTGKKTKKIRENKIKNKHRNRNNDKDSDSDDDYDDYNDYYQYYDNDYPYYQQLPIWQNYIMDRNIADPYISDASRMGDYESEPTYIRSQPQIQQQIQQTQSSNMEESGKSQYFYHIITMLILLMIIIFLVMYIYHRKSF